MHIHDLLASVSLMTLAACAGTAASEPGVPRGLAAAPSSSVQTLSARGVQIYECRAAADSYSPAQWMLAGPEAELFDRDGKRVGRHFAGPHWEADDGSRIVGGNPVRVPYSADYVFHTP
jgi:hypothetical protein